MPYLQHDRKQRLLEAADLAGADSDSGQNLSQKILLLHEASSQKNLRTRTRRVTDAPCHGKSATVRV